MHNAHHSRLGTILQLMALGAWLGERLARERLGRVDTANGERHATSDAERSLRITTLLNDTSPWSLHHLGDESSHATRNAERMSLCSVADWGLSFSVRTMSNVCRCAQRFCASPKAPNSACDIFVFWVCPSSLTFHGTPYLLGMAQGDVLIWPRPNH